MNKIFKCTAVCLSVLMLSTPTFAKNIVQVFVNEEKVQMDVKPVVKNGTTFIPLKAVGQGIGLTTNWNGQKKEIEVSDGNKKIILKLNSKTVTVNENGKITTKKLTEEPFIVSNSTTVVPVRFIVEEFSTFKSLWDASTYSFYITTDGSAPAVIEGVKPEVLEEEEVTPSKPSTGTSANGKPTSFVQPTKDAYVGQLKSLQNYVGRIGVTDNVTVSSGNTIKSGFITTLRGTTNLKTHSLTGEHTTYPSQKETNVTTTSNKHLKNEEIISFLLKHTDLELDASVIENVETSFYVTLTEETARELFPLLVEQKYVSELSGKTLFQGSVYLSMKYHDTFPTIALNVHMEFDDPSYMNVVSYGYSQTLMF